MARRARFGRRNRVQSSITGTLVAIAREMQAREDQNIMDAWRNGGEVHGRKVTDDMVLKYWGTRRKTLDKNDPTYDAINNQIDQLEYAVAQSKQDLLHVQGKISDQQFAQFYLKWAKKVPKDSEFWRVLQKDAASLMAQAKARRSGGSNDSQRIKTENFNKFVNDTDKRDIAVGSALYTAVHKYAEQSGMDLDANSDLVLARVTEDIKLHPGEYGGLLDAIKAARPGWNGVITPQFYGNEMQRAEKGNRDIAARSKRDGFVSNMRDAFKGASFFSDEGQAVGGWPTGSAYAAREAQFTQRMQAGDIVTQNAAAAEFGAWCDEQSKNPKLDMATREKLRVDAARLLGKGDTVDVAAPGYGDSVLGHGTLIQKSSEVIAASLKLQADKDAQPGAYVYAHIDSKGQFDPTSEGPIGIVPVASVPHDAVLMPQATAAGKGISVMTATQSVYAQDPRDGTKHLVGVIAIQKNGDVTTESFRYQDSSGAYHWADPKTVMADGVTETRDQNGNRVWMSPPDPQAGAKLFAAAQEIDKANGTTLAARVKGLLDAGTLPQNIDVTETARALKEGSTTTDSFTIRGGAIERVSSSNPSLSLTIPGAPSEGTGTTVRSTVYGPDSVSGAFSPNSVVDASFVKADAWKLKGVVFNSAAAKALNDTVRNMAGEQARQLLADPEFQMTFIQQEMNLLHTNDPTDARIAEDFRSAQSGATLLGPQNIERNPELANFRMDLSFPGAKQDAQGNPVSINFGGKTLVVPQVPKLTPSGLPSGHDVSQQIMPTSFTQAQQALAASPLGFGPAVSTPPVSAVPTTNRPTQTPGITPTPTPTPTPTATPTPTVSPVTPTPTPTPTTTRPPSPSTPVGQTWGGGA